MLKVQELHSRSGELYQLLLEEQERQCGRLVRGRGLDAYIDKLLEWAEFAVLEVDGRCQGFCAFYTYDAEQDSAFITLLLVAPDARGTGMASALLQVVAEQASNARFSFLSLKVRQDNMPAIRFYLKQGFQVVDGDEHDLMMQLDLETWAVR